MISLRLRIEVSCWLLRVWLRGYPPRDHELHRRAVRRRLRQQRGHRLLRLLRSPRRRVMGVVIPRIRGLLVLLVVVCPVVTPRIRGLRLLLLRVCPVVTPRIRGLLLLLNLLSSCSSRFPGGPRRGRRDPLDRLARRLDDRANDAIPCRTRLGRLVRVQTQRLGRRQTVKPLSQTVRDIGSVRVRPVRHRLHRRHLRVGLRRRGHGWRRRVGRRHSWRQHSWRRRVGRRRRPERRRRRLPRRAGELVKESVVVVHDGGERVRLRGDRRDVRVRVQVLASAAEQVAERRRLLDHERLRRLLCESRRRDRRRLVFGRRLARGIVPAEGRRPVLDPRRVRIGRRSARVGSERRRRGFRREGVVQR